MKTVRIGVIGCGKQTEEAHLPNLANMQDVSMVALGDLESERLERLGRLYNVSRLYSDYDELLESDLDAVVVCTPSATHAVVTLSAIKEEETRLRRETPSN
jgi:UDP-N-acetylglucosamine 3-dehydrogenase